VSSRSSSRNRAGPGRRSRSRSHSRKRHLRKSRRHSRSSSRSRCCSRSSPALGEGRITYRRAYAVLPGRRYYGFDPMVYPKEHSSWRERSRKRSWSRTPFHLSEKDKMELLEIAKASAAKSLGIANLDLPVSLKTVPVAKERNCETAVPNTAKFESLDNENASEYNTNTSMTQTIPKKKTKRLCYFNVRWKDIYSWIR
ncbi:hypothetical protein HPG69_004486, partial [Diceros bicornis minor]